MEAFVQGEVARGAVANEVDFLTKAAEMYRELQVRHEDLRAQVQESLAQYDQRESRALDTEATKVGARLRLSSDH